MRSSIEIFPKMLYLLKEKKLTPNKISMVIKSDRRTVNKMLDVAEKLGFVTFESMKIENRVYRTYTLSLEFKKFLKEAVR